MNMVGTNLGFKIFTMSRKSSSGYSTKEKRSFRELFSKNDLILLCFCGNVFTTSSGEFLCVRLCSGDCDPKSERTSL